MSTQEADNSGIAETAGQPEVRDLRPDTAARDLRSDGAKRRQIIDGACHIFMTQGFDAASMGAIAQHAGVSKGTLYVYFKSKDDLFAAIVEDQRRQQAELIFNFDTSEDIDAVLRRLGTSFIMSLCKPAGMSSLRTVIAIAHRMPQIGQRFYQAGPAFGIARLKDYLEGQVAAGVLEPHDCEVAAGQFIDSCASLIFRPMMFGVLEAADATLIDRVVGMAVTTYLRAWRKG